MSLINQMLRDLDTRRGPATGAHVAALEGMGLISVNRVRWRNKIPLLSQGLGGVLAVLLVYQAYSWWNDKPVPTPQQQSVAQNKLDAEPVSISQPPARTVTPAEPSRVSSTESRHVETTRAPAVTPAVDPAASSNKPPDKAAQKPVRTLSPKQEADRLFSAAQQSIASQQNQQAEALLRQTLSKHHHHVEARIQLAALLVAGNKPGEAERLLADGLKINPAHTELALPYVRLLVDRGALASALQILDSVINQNNLDPEALALRAAILYQMERYSESQRDYRQALTVQPNQALWWAGLAISMEHDNQLELALQAYQRAAGLPLDKPVMDYVQERMQVLRNINTRY